FQLHWSKATFHRRRPAEEFPVPTESSKPRAIELLLSVPRKNPSSRNRPRSGHQKSQGPVVHKACLLVCIAQRSDRSESCELTPRVWQVQNDKFARSSIRCSRSNADFSRSSNGP